MIKLKDAKGITLIALIITVIILLILAGISLNLVIGKDGIVEKSKMAVKISTREEIKESLEMEVGRSYDDDVTLDIQKLKNNIKKDFQEDKREIKIAENEFPIVVIIQEYAYEIDENGKVEYLGKENELIDKTTIEANPTENTTPELIQKVNVTVKTVIGMEDDDITLIYAWSNNKNTKPEESQYTKAQLTGSAKNKKAQIASNNTEEGNYYLWVKAIIEEKEIEKTYGPYAIKDHTALVKSSGEISSSSAFLGGKIKRNKIESVRIETSLEGHKVEDENCWDVSENKSGKYLAWYEDTDSDGFYEVTIAGEGGVVANSNSSYLFSYIGYNGDNTTVFYGLENLETDLVTDMSYMFRECEKVSNLDLSNFNTNNVTNMESMFYFCKNLNNLNISNFVTSDVINMKDMFARCSNLASLDVSNFNTEKVTKMNGMFSYCTKLRNIDISAFNTISVTSMNTMFGYCENLENINFGNINTSNTTEMYNMFSNCKKIKNIDISKLNTGNVRDMHDMFSYCEGLESIDLRNMNTKNVESMGSMFNNCKSLESIDLRGLDTGKVTRMDEMLSYCSKLKDVKLGNIDTKNVTNMSEMFKYSLNIESIDLSGLDTSSVTNMSEMFYSCNKLQNLDASNFNINKVTSWTNMFTSVPSSIKIKTNNDTATWIKENFTNITDANIELVS